MYSRPLFLFHGLLKTFTSTTVYSRPSTVYSRHLLLPHGLFKTYTNNPTLPYACSFPWSIIELHVPSPVYSRPQHCTVYSRPLLLSPQTIAGSPPPYFCTPDCDPFVLDTYCATPNFIPTPDYNSTHLLNQMVSPPHVCLLCATLPDERLVKVFQWLGVTPSPIPGPSN